MNTGVQLNYLLVLFLVLYILAASVRAGLHALNISHLRLRGHEIPREFSGIVDKEKFEEIQNYTIATGRLGVLRGLSLDIFLPALVLSGFLPWLSGAIASRDLTFVLSGILFFFGCYVLIGLFELPFDLFQTFRVEKRFSFSTITWSTWAADLVKSVLVSALLLGILLAGIFSLIRLTPDGWWLWAWLFFIVFQLLVSWLYPVVISPLFNKFAPVKDSVLARDIASLADRAGFRVKGIDTMDAIRRSRHSNAYFTGIGKSKRIVLFDTLLKDLKAEGFYVQMMNIDDGLSQARLGDIALSITEEEHKVTIETAPSASGNRMAALTASPVKKSEPSSITATMVTAYVSNRSAAIPAQSPTLSPVSYTHLTLPTISSV